MKTSAKVSLVVLGVILSLLVLMLWYPLKAARNVAKARACMENFKPLNVALSAYLKDNGRYPARLSELYPKHISDLSVFVCPARPHRITSPEQVDSQCGYVLLLPGVTPSEDRGEPLLCDRRSNHLNKVDQLWGGHILYCDGHFLWKMDKRAAGDWEDGFRFDFPE